MVRLIWLIPLLLLLPQTAVAASEQPVWRFDIELVHHPEDDQHPWRMRVTDTSSRAKALGYEAPAVKCYLDYQTLELQARIPLRGDTRRLNYAVAWYAGGPAPKQVVCHDSLEDHELVVRFDVPRTTDTNFLFRLFLRAELGAEQKLRTSSAGWSEPLRVVLFLSPKQVFSWVRSTSDKLAAIPVNEPAG